MLYNIWYPSETHLKLKCRETSFAHNICLNNPIVLKFCTEPVLCAKFQNDWTIATNVLDKWYFARFEFKVNFGRISPVAQHPSTVPVMAIQPKVAVSTLHADVYFTRRCHGIPRRRADLVQVPHTYTREPPLPSHRCGHPQAACREPAGSYDKTSQAAICFEHKTKYILIRAPYTRIVVFWHISNIPPMISQSQISCNTPTFCIAAIFVKYCYTTGSWLL